LLNNRSGRKKKVQLINWFEEEEDFPIIIQGDKLAKKPKAVPAPTQQVVYVSPEEEERPVIQTISANPTPVKKIKKGMLGKGFKSGTVSINAMLNDSGPKSEEEEIEDFSDRPRTPFNEEDFKAKWNQYIGVLKKDKRASLTSTMLSCRPEIGENFLLNMVFDNKVQESEFNHHKTELLGFLRESLNNWGIQIETEVRVEEQKKKYYTNKERFERMAELNPKLAELRKRLNLDPDY
tara:strand:- start:2736 stop:3443 length:708 start_codon:yes stop_codon:yes gene_type:complete